MLYCGVAFISDHLLQIYKKKFIIQIQVQTTQSNNKNQLLTRYVFALRLHWFHDKSTL